VRVRPDCKATGESFTASHIANGSGPESRLPTDRVPAAWIRTVRPLGTCPD